MKILMAVLVMLGVLGGTAFAWYNEDYSSGGEVYVSPNLGGGYNVSTPSGSEFVVNPTFYGNTYSESY